MNERDRVSTVLMYVRCWRNSRGLLSVDYSGVQRSVNRAERELVEGTDGRASLVWNGVLFSPLVIGCKMCFSHQSFAFVVETLVRTSRGRGRGFHDSVMHNE